MVLKEFYVKLGKKIKYLREQAGMTQEQLAEAAGISLDFLGKIEVCINRPGLKTIFKLAVALNISPAEFFLP